MLNRLTRNLKPTLAFTPLESELLDRRSPEPIERGYRRGPSLNSCLRQLARLGGYPNRARDVPPGNTVIWRSLSRLTDIEIGYLLDSQHVGN